MLDSIYIYIYKYIFNFWRLYSYYAAPAALAATRYFTNWKPIPASFLFVSLISMHMKTSATSPKALLGAAFPVHWVRLFHLLFHQLFSHRSAVIMNITIIPLVHFFHILLLQAKPYIVCCLTEVHALLDLYCYRQWEETFIRMIYYAESEFTYISLQTQAVHSVLNKWVTCFKNMNDYGF